MATLTLVRDHGYKERGTSASFLRPTLKATGWTELDFLPHVFQFITCYSNQSFETTYT